MTGVSNVSALLAPQLTGFCDFDHTNFSRRSLHPKKKIQTIGLSKTKRTFAATVGKRLAVPAVEAGKTLDIRSQSDATRWRWVSKDPR